jgi:hypothetical protein
MKRISSILWASVAVIALCPASSPAGTTIDLKTVHFGEARPDETATIRLGDHSVRFDAIEDGRETILIFRLLENGEPLCWVIDKLSKTYVELADEAPGDTEEPSRPGQDAEFRKIASGVIVKDWSCTQYEAYVRGQKQEDLWTTAEKNLGLTAAQVEILRQMGEFFAKISAETNAFFQVGRAREEGGFEGFPVIVVEYENGKKTEKSEVTGVRREKIESDVFELPRGARRRIGFDG